MSILLNNKLLQATEKKLEAGLTPDNRDDYFKIVVAGMRTALDQGPNGIMASLKQSKDPVSDAAIGAVNLVLLMRKQSQGTMPPKALVPAAMTLMLQALDFCDKAGITKITAQKLDRATHIFANHMFRAFNVTPQNLRMLGSKVHAVMQDPRQMDVIAKRVGVVKAEAAPAPAPLAGTPGR